jgi:hypothetical protein
MILAEKAESELIPQQQPPHRKSKAVIVLQLLKRWRNIRYDDRNTRKPPAIMIAKLSADAANTPDTLSEELLHPAHVMLAEFRAWQAEHRLIYVENPSCRDDVLTDHWPGTLHAQQVFIRDLEDLVVKVERLVGGCSLAEMRIIMADLFGEAPTEQAFRDFNHRIGHAVRDGHSYHVPGTGRLSVPTSGVLAGETALAQARATPRHNFFGTEQLHR